MCGSNKGFTLVELIVSIAILVLMVFGIAGLFSRATSAGRRAEKMTTAVNLAQAQIESVLAFDYGTLSTGTFETRHTIFENYSRQTQVVFIDPANLAPVSDDRGLKRATVTVFYPTTQGERTIELSTITSER